MRRYTHTHGAATQLLRERSVTSCHWLGPICHLVNDSGACARANTLFNDVCVSSISLHHIRYNDQSLVHHRTLGAVLSGGRLIVEEFASSQKIKTKTMDTVVFDNAAGAGQAETASTELAFH